MSTLRPLPSTRARIYFRSIRGKLGFNTLANVGFFVLMVLVFFFAYRWVTQQYALLDDLHYQRSVVAEFGAFITEAEDLLMQSILLQDVTTIPELMARSEDFQVAFVHYQDMAGVGQIIYDLSFAQENEPLIATLRSNIVNAVVLLREGRYQEAGVFYNDVIKWRAIAIKHNVEGSIYSKDLQIEQAQATLARRERIVLFLILGIVISAIGVIALINVRIGTTITKPLSALVEATDEIGRGKLDHVVPVYRDDEIGALATSFNAMVNDLQRITVSQAYLDIPVASHRSLTRRRIQGIGLDHLGPNPIREPQPKKVLEIDRSRPRQHVLVYASGAAPGQPLIAPTDGLNSWGKAPLKKHVNTCIFDCPVPGTLQYQFAPTKSDCLRIAERARGYC